MWTGNAFQSRELPVAHPVATLRSRQRFLANAHERGADATILDLEDGVAPHRKDAARARVLDARTIAKASPRVFAQMTGGEDLATALGSEPTPEVLYSMRYARLGLRETDVA